MRLTSQSAPLPLLGQVTGATTPNSGTTSMSYDPNGNLTGTTDADGHSLT